MIKSYNELPIGKYMRIVDTLEKQGVEDIDRLVTLIAILNDKTEDEVLTMPVTEFTTLAEGTTFLYGEKPQFKGKVTSKVVLDGHPFHVTSGINELTTAQYIDFQTFAKEPQKYLVQLLSIFLIPDGKKYNDGYNILEAQKIIRDNLTAPHATAIVSFFLRRLEISIRAILISLTWRMMWRKRKQKKTMATIKQLRTALESNGDGRSLSI